MVHAELRQQIRCSICLNILAHPVTPTLLESANGSCNHKFCKQCVTDWAREQKEANERRRREEDLDDSDTEDNVTCPECRQPMADTAHNADSLFKSMIDDLPTECPYCKEWNGAYKQYLPHVEQKCPALVSSCPFEGCNFLCARDKMEEHKAACPKRLVPCKYAEKGCESEIPADACIQHESSCLYRARRCSAADCDFVGTYKDMKHCCSDDTVKCPIPGCRSRMARRLIHKHMQESGAVKKHRKLVKQKINKIEQEVHNLKKLRNNMEWYHTFSDPPMPKGMCNDANNPPTAVLPNAPTRFEWHSDIDASDDSD